MPKKKLFDFTVSPTCVLDMLKKQKMGWRSSRFKYILFFSFAERFGANVIGVFTATSYTDAFSINLIYFFEFLKDPVFFIFNLKIIIYCYFSCIIQI